MARPECGLVASGGPISSEGRVCSLIGRLKNLTLTSELCKMSLSYLGRVSDRACVHLTATGLAIGRDLCDLIGPCSLIMKLIGCLRKNCSF